MSCGKERREMVANCRDMFISGRAKKEVRDVGKTPGPSLWGVYSLPEQPGHLKKVSGIY